LKRSTGWRLGITATLVVAGTLLAVCAAVAQAPPPAPVAPEKNPADANVPPVPGGGKAGAKDQADQMRRLLEAMRAMSAAPVMQIAGEHVYLLYGGILCQFATNGLKLEAKVDVREALGINQQPAAGAGKLRRKDQNAAPPAPAPAPAGGALKQP